MSLSSAHAAAPVTERRLAVVGAAMVALGPISLALYTPAMPEIAAAFHAEESAVHMTLTAFFGGFAVAQLVCGPLSDAFGRKPVGLLFFLLYLAGSVAAILAPTIDMLTLARLMQGSGAAAGIALARAMVRDRFTGLASTRIMTLIGIMLAIGPAVAPLFGGVALTFFGWHAIFVVMLAYGAVILLVFRAGLPETLPHPPPRTLDPGKILRDYRTLFADAGFMRPSLLIGLTVGGLYALATILPFVLIGRLGLAPAVYGIAMLSQTLSYLAGGLVARWAMTRMSAERLVPAGLVVVMISGTLLAVALRMTEPSVALVLVPIGLWGFGIALVIPSSQTAALAGVPHIAGSAAALMGFIQMASGFLAGIAATFFADQAAALETVPRVLAERIG